MPVFGYFGLTFLFLQQVNPPESPEIESPLQGSLHSVGSSGSSSGNIHDDFVMVDFVSPHSLLLDNRSISDKAQVSAMETECNARQ